MKSEDEMANPALAGRNAHEEQPPSIPFTGQMPIRIQLAELPETAEEIRELVQGIVSGIRSVEDFPRIAPAEAEAMASEIESQLTAIVAAHRFDQVVLDATSAAFSPLRKAIKGLGRIHRGREHAG